MEQIFELKRLEGSLSIEADQVGGIYLNTIYCNRKDVVS
jgi:hypothetical protein